MQLPYIAELLESSGRREHCFVVTIMVGSTSPESEVQLGTCLAPYLVDPANVFVISTDFCHWGGRFGYQVAIFFVTFFFSFFDFWLKFVLDFC